MGTDPAPGVGTSEVASAPPRSAGGTLLQVVAHLRSMGEPCAASPDGTYAWIQSPRRVLTRFPLECTTAVAASTTRPLLRLGGVWVVNYLLDAGEERGANCWDYVRRDPRYDVETLDSNARRDVRRGLRSFDVRVCTWREWAEQGFAALDDTERRHGYAAPDPAAFRRVAERWKDQPFYEIWGAWHGADLAAWLTVLKVDDWALIDLVRSRTDALRGCPNNAVLYMATHSLLRTEGRRYVSYGTSTLQLGTDEQSMHRYKLRMGYEAVPMRRVFVCRPAYRPLFESRVMSWTWATLTSAFPSSAALRKIAGMSKLLAQNRSREPASGSD